MALFQHSVLNKYLQELDKQQVEAAFNKFVSHFGNTDIQNNIRNTKEEEYQEGFIRDLFVNVLGYTLKPQPNFNIVLEKKNVNDTKKADGAIIKNDSVFAVIELKGTDTISLDSVKTQIFGYKNEHKNCNYLITSNFEKLRFYIEDATEHEEFELFNLSKEKFALLFLCLSKDNLLNDIPLKIKQSSLKEEESITKKLYNDYSTFKNLIFTNIVELNPQYDKLLLYKKTQKLLDRFLFIFFAEDRLLLPPNSIREIIKQWEQLKELDSYTPLYDRYKRYFNYLNTGHKGKEHDIFAYNGGLFEPDEILDNIKIDDQILFIHTHKLSDYDYESEIDVNILGHIFEHSLNEIEEVQAELEGQAVEKNKTKRKKDGIFYTPKYITKYIVDNTLGALCEEKKKELGINEDEFSYNKRKAKRKELIEILDKYRNWLLKLTICDPACGSGAFLNQALNYLIEEHRFIDELKTAITKQKEGIYTIIHEEYANIILENNIFGVDLNDESIEIAKLSLWLRTAQKGRKLTSLSKNIKCGNSLIDDKAIAGDKAFNWQNEFPEVFANGGFDVIIGNPPYIKEATNKNAFNGLHNHPCYQGKMDLWYFFGWIALEIVKKNTALIGYIAPNNWITNDGAFNFRNKVLRNAKLFEFVDFGDYKVFESAGIQTMIYIMNRNENNVEYSFNYSKIIDKNVTINEIQGFLSKLKSDKTQIYLAKIVKENSINNILNFPNETINIILNKIEARSNFRLEGNELNSGIDIGQDFVNNKSKLILGENFNIGDGVFNLSKEEYLKCNFTDIEKSLLKPFYTSKEINRYLSLKENNYWVIYTSSKFKNIEEIIPYPNIKAHLDKFNKIITSDNKPYGLHRTRNEKIFKGEKILSIRKCFIPSFSYVDFDSYVNRTYNIIQSNRIDLKFLTTLLNSSVVRFWLKGKGKLQGELFQVDINPILSIPLINISKDVQQPFIEKADIMLSKNKELQELKTKFIKLLTSKYSELKITNKLEELTGLDFKGFSKELEKQKIKLSLAEQSEWLEYFEKEKAKAQEIKAIIEKTDKEIDNMVYKLYELTEEEIRIVEGGKS
jgi:type I restriction-modification system DNA methylase subunit